MQAVSQPEISHQEEKVSNQQDLDPIKQAKRDVSSITIVYVQKDQSMIDCKVDV